MIGSSENRISYNGNGIATEFAYNFIIIEKSDIKVLHVAADGTEQLLTKDYYVDMEKSVVLYPGYAPGAEIPESERPPILPIGERLVLYREVPITQDSALDKHWPFNVIEAGLDKLTIICQQIWDRANRSFYVSPATNKDFNSEVPIAPGKTFRVKDDGTGFEVTEDPGKVIDGATALLKQTTEQSVSANEAATNAQNAAKEVKEIYGDGNFTPLSDLLGGLGTKLKRWGAIFANKVFASNLPIVYNSVAEMKADTLLWEGMSTKTLGYYRPNDGGGANYLIRAKADSDVDNGGSIHELRNGLVAEMIIENSTVCPEQFGARGDGVTDDSAIFKVLVSLPFTVYLTKKYYIAASIAENETLEINFVGNVSLTESWYKCNGCHFIVADKISLFKNCEVSGCFERIGFVGYGDERGTSNTIQYVFENCTLIRCDIIRCYFLNFESIFYKTVVKLTSKFNYNTCLSVYNFAKNDTNEWMGCGDIEIIGNYINGGIKYNNNICFGFAEMGATIVADNFIDFYCYIYKADDGGYQPPRYTLPTSIGNRYEAFRYFISIDYADKITGTFIGDCFSHTNPNSEETPHVGVYVVEHETYNNKTYDLPPYIAKIPRSKLFYNVTFDNINFGIDCADKPICHFVPYGLFTNGNGSRLIFNVSNDSRKTISKWVSYDADFGISIFSNNNDTEFLVTNVYEVLNELPELNSYSNQHPIVAGLNYIYNNNNYRCKMYYDANRASDPYTHGNYIALVPECPLLETIHN